MLYGCEWILWGQSSSITHCKSPVVPLVALSALVGVVDVAFVADADKSAGMGVSIANCASESFASFVATVVTVATAAATAEAAGATTADESVVGETVDVDNSIGVSVSLATTIDGVVFAIGDDNIGATTVAGVVGGTG